MSRLLSFTAVFIVHAAVLSGAFLAPRSPDTPAQTILRASLVAGPQRATASEKPREEPKPLPARPRPSSAKTKARLARETPAVMPSPSPETVQAVEPEAMAQKSGGESGEITEPSYQARYLDNPAPVYPPLSKRLKEEGKVILKVFVEKNGRPAEVVIHGSSGFERLDEAALRAVRVWKFVPARRGEEEIAAWVLVPISFHLRGKI